MGRSCVFIPEKGKETFFKLKENFGHEIAASVFNRIITDKFIEDYENSLTLDSEGVPSYSSIIKLPIVRNYIGEQNILASLNRKLSKTLPNTVQNVSILVNEAIQMNSQEQEHLAIVDYTEDGNLILKIVSNNKENQQIAGTQAAINKLNQIIVEKLGSAGVTVESLSSIEVAAGKVGETNFRHLKSIADEFAGLIRVADNMEGSIALSEEFSHLLVRIYRNTPLMQRALTWLKDKKNSK